MVREAHSLEVRTKALAMIAAGNTPRYVARQLGLPAGTVKSWRDRQKGAQLAAATAAETRAAISKMMWEFLQKAYATLDAQMTVMLDPEYVRKQEIGRVAVAYGILADKAERVRDGFLAGAQEHTIEQLREQLDQAISEGINNASHKLFLKLEERIQAAVWKKVDEIRKGAAAPSSLTAPIDVSGRGV